MEILHPLHVWLLNMCTTHYISNNCQTGKNNIFLIRRILEAIYTRTCERSLHKHHIKIISVCYEIKLISPLPPLFWLIFQYTMHFICQNFHSEIEPVFSFSYRVEIQYILAHVTIFLSRNMYKKLISIYKEIRFWK